MAIVHTLSLFWLFSKSTIVYNSIKIFSRPKKNLSKLWKSVVYTMIDNILLFWNFSPTSKKAQICSTPPTCMECWLLSRCSVRIYKLYRTNLKIKCFLTSDKIDNRKKQLDVDHIKIWKIIRLVLNHIQHKQTILQDQARQEDLLLRQQGFVSHIIF